MTVGDQDTHGIYGFLRMLRPAVNKFSMLTPVVLWDGRSWRKDRFTEYKAGRDEAPATKAELMQAETRASFKSQRPFMMQALAMLGVTQIAASNLEADDLAGAMVRRYAAQGKHIIMLTGDKDWIQLVGRNIGWLDPVARNGVFRNVTLINFEKQTGVKTPRAFLETKALMGDPSDEIPGVGGIGAKGAAELVNAYGSVVDFLNESITAKNLPKKFQTLADDMDKQGIYRRNIMLMDLCHPEIPKPINLKINKGEFSPERFGGFCRGFLFKSMLTDIDTWMQPFKRIEE